MELNFVVCNIRILEYILEIKTKCSQKNLPMATKLHFKEIQIEIKLLLNMTFLTNYSP